MAAAAVASQPGLPAGPKLEATYVSKPKAGKHNVDHEMEYFALEEAPKEPYYIGKPGTELAPMTKLPVTIHDVAGDEDKYTLDVHGFQFVKHESKEKEFLDVEKIKSEYYAETEQLVKDLTGCSRTYVFNHAVRRAPIESFNGSVPGRGPAFNVHLDQTYEAGPARVRRYFPEEADELLKKRYQIINVWRPIKTVYKDPFAVLDARSVKDEDIIPVTFIYPWGDHDQKGSVKPNKDHMWYYKYEQRPDEPMVFKQFDSITDGKARRNPHSAFTDPAHEDGYMRESLEVRMLTFFDE